MQPAEDGSEPRGQTRPAGPAPDARTNVLFDANADGIIESWSIAHGGDSFADFSPPPTGATTPSRAPERGADGRPRDLAAVHAGTAGHDGPGASLAASTPAAMHHARRAYQHDGIASGPAAPTPVPARSVGGPTAAGPRPAARS
jgi:hypothetical protein